MNEPDLFFILLHITTVMIVGLYIYIQHRRKKTQSHKIFLCILALQIVWCISVITGGYIKNYDESLVIYTEYFAYIGICLLPVSLLLMGMIFARTKIKYNYKYLLLLIVPILSLIILWTSDYHNLFFENFSVVRSEIIFGNYFIVHSLYSYVCILIGLYHLVYFSIKNAGFFSKQAILVIIGTTVPLVVNILFTMNLFTLSIYATPVAFSFAIICYVFAILKYDFLSISPVALQNVVDRISDGFVVLDEEMILIDYNKSFFNTFSKLFKVERKQSIHEILKNSPLEKEKTDGIIRYIHKATEKSKPLRFETHLQYKDFDKYFTIEVTPIIVNSIFIGTVILLKDVTQNVLNIRTIKQKQAILMEQERLASLGQLIGGIAHNLKTPIMSIAGGFEALKDLASEYDESIDDDAVTKEDHHEIAREMLEWIDKVKPYCSYMSDVISAVKGQAVYLSDSTSDGFTLDELLKRVDILMKHELKKFHCRINIHSEVNMKTEFKGEMNNLVQIFDNIIVNAIHAYGKKSGEIDLNIVEREGNIVFSFRDYGSGMPEKVQKKLFKEMFTTKGKFGTGLGLYMSYSTIKGRFNGDMWFESELNKGTTFYISIPNKKASLKDKNAEGA